MMIDINSEVDWTRTMKRWRWNKESPSVQGAEAVSEEFTWGTGTK